MRREHRTDHSRGEEGPQRSLGDAGFLSAGQRISHAPLTWRRTIERVSAPAADGVLVFSEVGEVGQVAEGTDGRHGLAGQQAVEPHLEFAPRALVLVAVEADRGLANLLDDLEHGFAILATVRVAEQASQTDDARDSSRPSWLQLEPSWAR